VSSMSIPFPTEFLVEVLSDSAEMTWFPIMHEPHVLFEESNLPMELENYYTKTNGTQHVLIC